MATNDDAQTPYNLDNLSVFEAFELLRGIKVEPSSSQHKDALNPIREYYEDVTCHLCEKVEPKTDFSGIDNSWNWPVKSEAPKNFPEAFRRNLEHAAATGLKLPDVLETLPIEEAYDVDEDYSNVLRLRR